MGMIEFEITKHFNNNVMFPMDIYEINLVYRYGKETEDSKGTE